MENVSGLDLVPKLIRKYITELMEPGKAYSTPDITHLVHDHHQSKDGIPSDVRDPDKQVRAELTKLKKGGVVQSTVDSKWILVAEADEALPEERVLKSEDEADAEVSIGEGRNRYTGGTTLPTEDAQSLKGKLAIKSRWVVLKECLWDAWTKAKEQYQSGPFSALF